MQDSYQAHKAPFHGDIGDISLHTWLGRIISGPLSSKGICNVLVGLTGVGLVVNGPQLHQALLVVHKLTKKLTAAALVWCTSLFKFIARRFTEKY
jgi:hypothetical protein